MTDIVDRIKDAENATNALFDHVFQHAREEIERLRTENAGLVDDINLLRDNNTALRARIEAMEKQEPVAVVDYKRGSCVRFVEYLGWQKIKDGAKLYALPGAKGE